MQRVIAVLRLVLWVLPLLRRRKVSRHPLEGVKQ
jgi:hypothetical protein